MSEKEEFQRFSVSLPQKMFEEFEVFRKKRNLSRSDAIRKAMTEYMLKESKNEINITEEYVTAIIILNMEHYYPGPEHTHGHGEFDEPEHIREHEKRTQQIIDEIVGKSYFMYQDTDLIKINHFEHLFHDIVITKLHVHAEHDRCILVIPVRGPGRRIQQFYNNIIKLKSVRSHQIFVE